MGGPAHRHGSDLRRSAGLRRSGGVDPGEDPRPGRRSRRCGAGRSRAALAPRAQGQPRLGGPGADRERPVDAQPSLAASELWGGSVVGYDDWEQHRLGDATVTIVPALHGPPGSLWFGGPVVGFVLEKAGRADRLRQRRQRLARPGRADRRPLSVDRHRPAVLGRRARSGHGCRPHPDLGGCRHRGPPARQAPRGRPARRRLGALQREPLRPRGGVRRGRAVASCWWRRPRGERVEL